MCFLLLGASLIAQLVKNPPAMCEFDPWIGSPGEGEGYPLQYPGLENSMNYIVHRVTKSQTRRSNFHFTSLSIIMLNEIISNNIFNIYLIIL